MNHAEELRALALQIEDQPSAREAIAAGFRMIADAMEGKPCEDCTSQQGQALAPTFCQKCLTHSDSLHRERYCTCGDPINGPKQGQALDPDDNPEAGADTATAGVDLVDTATGPGLEG